MEITLVIIVDGNRLEWILKLKKLLSIINQASTTWYDLLKTGLESRGYHQYQVDSCAFVENTQLF